MYKIGTLKGKDFGNARNAQSNSNPANLNSKAKYRPNLWLADKMMTINNVENMFFLFMFVHKDNHHKMLIKS